MIRRSDRPQEKEVIVITRRTSTPKKMMTPSDCIPSEREVNPPSQQTAREGSIENVEPAKYASGVSGIRR